jgi:lipopolysaccharide/colanic/teichoic acid biosynthesis glycosyltransferase
MTTEEMVIETDLPVAAEEVSSAEAEYRRTEERSGYRVAKRLFDIVFSCIVIALLIIPVIILSVVISIETHGNPFYTQVRVGRRGDHFKVLKFRSMVLDAHNVKKYLTPQQIEIWEFEGKVDDDPRITQIGRFIRKTSIDEIPQFLNVLMGTMSVVGPRPITDKELEQFGSNKDRFLSIKPGITGWWQVSERNSVKFEDGSRQKVELHYIDHRSMKLDVLIFFKTFSAVLKKTGQ